MLWSVLVVNKLNYVGMIQVLEQLKLLLEERVKCPFVATVFGGWWVSYHYLRHLIFPDELFFNLFYGNHLAGLDIQTSEDSSKGTLPQHISNLLGEDNRS